MGKECCARIEESGENDCHHGKRHHIQSRPERSYHAIRGNGEQREKRHEEQHLAIVVEYAPAEVAQEEIECHNEQGNDGYLSENSVAEVFALHKAVFGKALIGLEQFKRLRRHHIATVDDSLTLLHHSYWGKSLLVELVDHSLRFSRVAYHIGNQISGDAHAVDSRLRVGIGENRVEHSVCRAHRAHICRRSRLSHIVHHKSHLGECSGCNAVVGGIIHNSIYVDAAHTFNQVVTFLSRKRSALQCLLQFENRFAVNRSVVLVDSHKRAVNAVALACCTRRVEIDGNIKRSGEQRVVPRTPQRVVIINLILLG